MKQGVLFRLLLVMAFALLAAGCSAQPGQPTLVPTLSMPTAAQPTVDMPVTGQEATATAAPTTPQEEPTAPVTAAVEEPPVSEPVINCAAPAALTPSMTEGPYYKPDSPERTSLLEPDTPGTRMLLTGYVLTADCQPVANAWLDFWQTDGEGQYDNVGYKMRGHQFTDENGRFQLETVVPGEYPGRTPHIHVKVRAPDGPELTSQLFIPGAAGNQTDRIFDPALLVTVLDESDGVQAAYNFVIQTQ